MPKNKSEDLNNILFETMEKLLSGDIDARQADAIAKTAQVVVNNSKNELQFIRQVGGLATGSGFFSANNTSKPKQLESFAMPKKKTMEIQPDAEMPNCKCGEEIFPADLERSANLGLDYPRCRECLLLLPQNAKDLNGGGK